VSVFAGGRAAALIDVAALSLAWFACTALFLLVRGGHESGRLSATTADSVEPDADPSENE